MSYEKIPTAVEVKVVSLIARGDTYDSIRSQIKRDFNHNISAGVITAVKKRNAISLENIKDAIVKKEQNDAEGLLQRSHRLLGKKLRNAESAMEEYEDIQQQYISGEIDWDQFHLRTKFLDLPKINELTTVAREMFAQTKAGQEVAGGGVIGGDPKEKLKQLQQMLDENDEIRLERIIFAKRDQSNEVLSVTNEAEPVRRDADGDPLHGSDLPDRDNPDRQEAQDPSAA